jgi:hypothetical protein
MRSQIYFPIERAKAGEFGAMAALYARTKSLTCPMFDLPVVDGVEAFDLLQSNVASSLARTWGTKGELFLDLFRYEPDSLIHGDTSYVERLFTSARQAGLKAIPVAGPVLERNGKTGSYLKGVAEIAARDGRGAAIRLPFHDLTNANSLGSVIDAVQQSIGLNDADCDVFLDAGPADFLPGGLDTAATVLYESISAAVEALNHRSFRSLVLCASSIPRSSKNSKKGDAVRVPNFEFRVWNQLLSSRGNQIVRFGDYGARFANQSDKKVKARAPARIHLSTRDFHVLHVGASESYRDLARKVSATPRVCRADRKVGVPCGT